jgi:hypothetical protein
VVACATSGLVSARALFELAVGLGDPEEKTKEILYKASRFVVLADQPIRWAAVGLLGLIPKSSELTRDKTARLSDELWLQVTHSDARSLNNSPSKCVRPEEALFQRYK